MQSQRQTLSDFEQLRFWVCWLLFLKEQHIDKLLQTCSDFKNCSNFRHWEDTFFSSVQLRLSRNYLAKPRRESPAAWTSSYPDHLALAKSNHRIHKLWFNGLVQRKIFRKPWIYQMMWVSLQIFPIFSKSGNDWNWALGESTGPVDARIKFQ